MTASDSAARSFFVDVPPGAYTVSAAKGALRLLGVTPVDVPAEDVTVRGIDVQLRRRP